MISYNLLSLIRSFENKRLPVTKEEEENAGKPQSALSAKLTETAHCIPLMKGCQRQSIQNIKSTIHSISMDGYI